MDRKLPHKNSVCLKGDVIMRKYFDHLKIIKSVLYRETQDILTKETVRQIVLPAVYKDTAFRLLHSAVDHPGNERTLYLVRERFFWPCITADVGKFVGLCDRCLRRKSPTNSRTPLNSIETIETFSN